MSMIDLAAVEALIRHVGDTLLMRHWRALEASHIREKSRGDFVTDVDEEAERLLSAGLLGLAPHAMVLGEEAAAADPQLLDQLQRNGDIWVIDPIDGTGNYVEGKPTFAIMVALVRDGRSAASWIYQPVHQKMFQAVAGQGATCNGQLLRLPSVSDRLADLHVGISVKFTPEPLRGFVSAQIHHFASHAPYMCAGFEYGALAQGEKAMAMFHRLFPWDHLPGLLIVREVGLVIRHFDGTAYDPRMQREGLIVAANDALWHACRDLLVPPELRA